PIQNDAHREEISEEPIEPFIPPQAERPVPVMRAPRMPRIDELPIPAQNELRAKRGLPANEEALETKRMTLLQRLANIGGMTRRDGEIADSANHLRPVTKPRETEIRQAAERRPRERVSEYHRAPAARSPIGEGGVRSVAGRLDEDELEIPAFLRR